LQRQIRETSHLAGKAEVAASALHNVGNVLNSVNVSSSIISDKMHQWKIANLGKAVALLREHESDLAVFLTRDPKGKQLLHYLCVLADHLAAEQSEMIKEIALLSGDIDHIKEIVAMQQSFSKVSGTRESVLPADLAEDALRISGADLDRHQIELVREYSNTPAITVEKHKVLQILVNLISNAKYACDDSKRADKRLTVRVALRGPDRIRISVADNGIGVCQTVLPRIFTHGFTTRPSGHGFGLHSGALAAREMGGSLTLHSDGAGKGAEFALELPLQPPEDEPAAPDHQEIPSPLAARRNGNPHPARTAQPDSVPAGAEVPDRGHAVNI
jgi:signal transduction histidine kinase